MSVIRFLHCADLHLGKTHSAMRTDGNTGRNLLAMDAEDQLREIIDIAIEEDVDFILHAGDMFDRININNTDVNRALGILSELNNHEIPFITIAGNHDRPFTRGVTSPIEFIQYLKNCYAIPRFGTHTLDIRGKKVAVHGISYLKRDVENEFRRIIEKLVNENKGDYNILLSHQSLAGTEEGFEWSSTKEPLVQRSVIPKSITYVAMGHIHKRQTLIHPNYPEIQMHYPGSSLVTDFGERNYEKAVSLVKIDDNVDITSIPLPTRSFREVVVELDNPTSVEAEQQITQAIENNLDKDLFLGIRIKGKMRLALKSVTMTNYYKSTYQNQLAGLHIYNKKQVHWLDEEGVSITYGGEWIKSPREELIEALNNQEELADEDIEKLLELGQEIVDEIWRSS